MVEFWPTPLDCDVTVNTLWTTVNDWGSDYADLHNQTSTLRWRDVDLNRPIVSSKHMHDVCAWGGFINTRPAPPSCCLYWLLSRHFGNSRPTRLQGNFPATYLHVYHCFRIDKCLLQLFQWTTTKGQNLWFSDSPSSPSTTRSTPRF